MNHRLAQHITESPPLSAAAEAPAKCIQILHLEDDPLDAELIGKKLHSSGVSCEITVAPNHDAFQQILQQRAFDLILCDYNLPGFDGLSALRLAHTIRPDIPVIIISGALDEEEAVGCLRNGATDYVLKQRLQRLGTCVTRAMASVQDKQELQTSRETENRLMAIMEATPDFIATSTPDGKMLYYNPGARHMLGVTDSETISNIHVEDIYPPEDAMTIITRGIPEAIRTGIWQGETTFVRRDGQPIPVSQVIIAHKDPDGRLQYLSTIARDIGARKAMEDALRQSEALFRNILETTPDGVLLSNPDGTITLANPMAEKIFGRQLLGFKLEQLMSSHPNQHVKYTPAAGHKENVTGYRKDGTEFPAEILFSRMSLPGKQYGLTVVRDVTEQRLLEHQFRQSQKMEAIGQLTGGLAHDFNNMLGIIIGNLDLLELELQGNESALKKVASSLKAALLGADLTKRLLAFARKQTLSPRNINMKTEIEEMLPLIERVMKGDYHIKLAIADDLPEVAIDPSEFENALLNLAINARDAMPEGGSFFIAAANISFSPEDTRHMGTDFQAGDYVRISLTDTGCGIPVAVIDRIFEPFFTTKGKGKGTGLGLAMVYGFIKQSQGHIRIYSEPGHGTVVHIYLPASKSILAGQAAPNVNQPQDTPFRTEGHHILVVDDEADLAEIARTYLESAGYLVTIITHSSDALDLINQGIRFDMVVSDLVMPGHLDGLELRQRILAIDPDMPILFASGFSEDAIKARMGGTLDTPILQKPFRKQDLLAAVENVLHLHSSGMAQP